MVSLHRVRRLIEAVEISDAWSTPNKIFIDFFDRRGEVRWYLLYSLEFRSFKVNRVNRNGRSMLLRPPDKLRRYLLELTPPEIIAKITATSLGVADPD